MNNEEIAKRFEQLAQMMEIRGDEFYRIRSYRNAAEIIREWPTELRDIAAEEGVKGLQALPGIGKAISGKTLEMLERGTFEAWEKLIAETPPTVLDLLKVDGIGMKTAAELYQRFSISSLDNLAQFIAGGGLEMVDGVGEKTAQRISRSVDQLMMSSAKSS